MESEKVGILEIGDIVTVTETRVPAPCAVDTTKDEPSAEAASLKLAVPTPVLPRPETPGAKLSTTPAELRPTPASSMQI